MRANGNATQWPDGYPGRIDAEEDSVRGHCFLVTDEAGPLAGFAFAPGPDETYSKIVGAWHSDANYHVIHRVAAVRGHGVARAIFKFAAERGLPALRHPRGQCTDAARARVVRIPRVRKDHGGQRNGARRL